MKHLKIGDYILSYDNENQKVVYTKVISWLHRDENSLLDYE